MPIGNSGDQRVPGDHGTTGGGDGGRHRYSRARRIARYSVWGVFAVVLLLRYLHPPEPMPRTRGAEWNGGDRRDRRGQHQFDGRRYRGPTPLREAVAAIPAELWRLEITVAPAEVEKLRGYFWNGRGGGLTERPDVPVTVREGGVTYTNVSLHLKGSAGSFRPFDDKPALTLNFGKNARGQKFHGLSKLSLNNSVQDSSYISESLCRELFLSAGIPVPKADHATVVLNGRDLGLYVLVAGWDKVFLKKHFKDAGGNLYDGGFVQDIDGNLTVASGEHPDERADLERLIEAASVTDRTERWKQLQGILDVDRFITVVAMDVLICNWDGYAMNRNNYRVFHDRTSDRMIFMPHGMDQVFGNRRMGPQSSIQPPIRGLVARAVLSTTEGRRKYFERLATLRTNVLDEAKLTNRVHVLAARIRPTLAAYGKEVAQELDYEVADMNRRISERLRSVALQLNPEGLVLKLDGAGQATLTGWQPTRNRAPGAGLDYERRELDGVKQLIIRARGGGGFGAWRTRVVLEPGQYRFVGKARTRGAGADGGVCFRPTGSPLRLRSVEGDEWVAMQTTFLVDEGEPEVDLVIEFAGAVGEAQIDEASLKLVRE